MFPYKLRREVVGLLLLKAVLLSVLYVLFFSPAHRVAVNESRLTDHLLNSANP
ncbi:MAG: phosphoglycerate mutase [Proteobacteria bacterium]|nr:phosphoglycerate mutase [Pseudomonadota bacterium]